LSNSLAADMTVLCCRESVRCAALKSAGHFIKSFDARLFNEVIRLVFLVRFNSLSPALLRLVCWAEF